MGQNWGLWGQDRGSRVKIGGCAAKIWVLVLGPRFEMLWPKLNLKAKIGCFGAKIGVSLAKIGGSGGSLGGLLGRIGGCKDQIELKTVY